MTPASQEAFDLLHQGAVALAEVESNGMRVDPEYLDRAISRTQKRLVSLEQDLLSTDVGRMWKKKYGSRMKLGADMQLASILYDQLGFPPSRITDGERRSTDREALEQIEHPFIQPFIRWRGLGQAVRSLKGIKREVVGDKIHCFFNLHTTSSYRSSSADFNFQNLPMRDPEIMELIRQTFIPRAGRQIVEIDYSGVEVRVAACYHKDPKMIVYITDPTTDMHRDVAQEVYILDHDQMTGPDGKPIKNIRYCGKNCFVFPQFYGAYAEPCAHALWFAIKKQNLVRSDGLGLYKHLAEKGIRTVEQYVKHIERIEKDFWGKRFAVYAEWKEDWYAAYQKAGYFQSLTGFVYRGYMRRNQVINIAVQGSAFHLLLWSLIRLISVEMRERGMKSLIVGQIHDSIVADVVPSEREDYLHLCRKVMTKKIRKFAPWLIVPLEVEADVSGVDQSWAAKKGYDIE